MEIEYYKQLTAMDAVDIDDVGNCALDMFNDEGTEYILVTKTTMGFTQILTFGPFTPEVDSLGYGCTCNYTKVEYDQRKLVKFIDTFLNDKTRKITQCINIGPEEATSKCRDIVEYFEENYD